MTFEEINNLTIESTFPTLLARIVDTSNLPQGAKPYMLDLDESKSFYERVIVHQSLVKPPLELIESELSEYKAELSTQEQARIDEYNRVTSIKERFYKIEDIHMVMAKTGYAPPNSEVELQRIIEENDIVRLEDLEVKAIQYRSEVANKKELEQKMAVVDSLVDICLHCIKIVMKHNIAAGLTKAQKDQQATDYSDVFQAIRDWRPGKAKSLISAMTPDGTLVTQALKDELLEFLTEKGL